MIVKFVQVDIIAEMGHLYSNLVHLDHFVRPARSMQPFVLVDIFALHTTRQGRYYVLLDIIVRSILYILFHVMLERFAHQVLFILNLVLWDIKYHLLLV
jgi:hypothetical protein